MFGLSGGEIVMILVLFLVLFGAKKIPEFAANLGKGMKEFKKAANDIQENMNAAVEEKPQPKNTAPTNTVSTTPTENKQ